MLPPHPNAGTTPPPSTGPGSGGELRAALARELEAGEDPSRPPPPVPDHTLLRCIGRGAYGEVWLARNTLGTLRAIKIVHRSQFREDRPYEREFHGILRYEPVSRTHEGLVQVLHVGRHAQARCFYYVMELADAAQAGSPSGPAESDPTVDGFSPRTLRSELARHRRLPAPEAAQLVLRLAAALAHLHAHGLVHRDIKPSNVIFVEGRPKLADIGLVTDVGSSQSFVGTEGFIPPEGPGTPQADLFGLGKLLYELATGRDRLDFPQLPLEDPALLELNEVMIRACAPKPGDRYRTATELQADLNLFLGGRSLRRMRNIERHLARLKRFAVAASVLMLLAAGAIWLVRNEERHANDRAAQAVERAQAEAALRQRAEAAEVATSDQLYTALLEQARATVRSGELGQRVRALDALRRAAAISNSVEVRRELVAALALPDLALQHELPFGDTTTLREPDPALERIALAQGPGPVEIRSIPELRLLATLPPATTNLTAFVGQWSPDGRHLAVKRDHNPSGERADLEVWDVPGARRVLLLRDITWNAASFHPHSPHIMAADISGTVTQWNLEDATRLERFRLPHPPRSLSYSPDGDRLAALSPDPGGSRITIHPLAAGEAPVSVSLPEFVDSVQWHPGGAWLAVPDHSGAVHRMEADSGALRLIGTHKAQAVSATFSPQGDYLITGGWERELVCWEVGTMRRAFDIPLDGFAARFSSKDERVAIFTRSTVQIHTLDRPSCYRAFAEPLGSRLRWAAFSPDGRWLAASAKDGMGVWDLSVPGPGAIEPQAYETRLFIPSEQWELFGTRSKVGDEDCFRWRLEPAAQPGAPPRLERLDLPKPEGFTYFAVGSGQLVMTGTKGSQVLSSTHTVADPNRWAPTHPGINAMSPDGRWLAIFQPFATTLHVHGLPGLETAATLRHPASIAEVVFSPSTEEMVICSKRGLAFWSTASWEPTRFLEDLTGILYTPDPRACWFTKDFRTAGLFDQRTLEPLLLVPKGMLPMALSKDGRHLAVSVDARRLEVWDLVELRSLLRDWGMDWGG